MFHYRQVLARLRAGDSERDVARSGSMGRQKVAALRELAQAHEPGEAAQVDFGAGPLLAHPDGRVRRTWAFMMTLAHSRRQ